MEGREQVEQKSLEGIEQAKALFVVSNEDFQKAGEFLKKIKGVLKEIDKKCDDVISAAHGAWKKALEQKKGFAAPLIESEKLVKLAMTKFTKAEEIKRLDQEKKLQEDAKKKREEDALNTATEAEEKGDNTAVDFALSEEIDTSNIKVESTVQKVAGIVVTKKWCWKKTDESLIPKEWWILDEKRIGARVRGDKEKTNIPGIEAYSEDVIKG